MKLSVKGTIVLALGVVVNGTVVYYVTISSNYIVSTIGTLVAFMGWLFVSSGLSSLIEVRKDRKARKGIPMTPALLKEVK